MIKKIIPKGLKFQIKLIERSIKDTISGEKFADAKQDNGCREFPFVIQIKQNVKQIKTNEAKNTNLELAINKIEKITVYPKQIFSFWKIVGKPIKKNGFVESRSIVKDEIVPSVGGGLCQLSGLIYYVALKAGLEIIERYPHSADIYNSETRFTPLGSDATVVYAYKDLRLKNNFGFPLSFSFSLNKDSISVNINSLNQIKEKTLSFKSTQIKGDKTRVESLQNGIIIREDIYLKNEA